MKRKARTKRLPVSIEAIRDLTPDERGSVVGGVDGDRTQSGINCPLWMGPGSR